jgi:hypothetical protein
MIVASIIGYFLLMFYAVFCPYDVLERVFPSNFSRSIEADYLRILGILFLSFTLLAIPIRIFHLLYGKSTSLQRSKS